MKKLFLFLLLACPIFAANTYFSKATGNFTAAGTWSPTSAVTAGFLDAVSGPTSCTTSFVYSATFTLAATNVSAVAVHVGNRVASPTGTVTITLANNTSPGTREGTTTIDVVSLDNVQGDSGWSVFAMSVAPNGTDVYKVGFKCSVNAEVSLYRDGTAGNWSRYVLLTSAASAPAAADILNIAGSWAGGSPGTLTSFTVTMDNTAATVFGSAAAAHSMTVSKGGTLTYGTSGTLLLTEAGLVDVFTSGTWNEGPSGTCAATRCDLLFSVAVNVDSGFRAEAGSTVNIYGATKTSISTLLNQDAASGQKVIHVADTTGWASNDIVGIASTTQTRTQNEECTVSTVDSSTQATCSVNLTAAHSGTSPTQGEVVNLTRNTKISGTSTSLQAYFYADTTATVHGSYAEFTNIGSNTANKQGIVSDTTTGTFAFDHCSLHDFGVANSNGFRLQGTSGTGVNLNANVIYNIATNAIFIVTAGTQVPSITNNVAISGQNTAVYNLADIGATLTGNTAVGGAQGFQFNESGSPTFGTCSNNTAHSNSTVGFLINNFTTGTCSSLTSWRNTTYGLQINLGGAVTQPALIIDGLTAFGNPTNVVLANGAIYSPIQFNNFTINGDTTFACTNGIQLGSSTAGEATLLQLTNSTFSAASGIKTACTNDINVSGTWLIQIKGQNVALNGTNAVVGPTASSLVNIANGSYVGIDKYNGVAGSYQAWYTNGKVSSDTGLFHTASPSERLTPLDASNKLQSGQWLVPIANGTTSTISVWINQSQSGDTGCNANYNGNPAQLILMRNSAIGLDADTVEATAAVTLGSWQHLTFTTPSASADGTWAARVAVDGTAGCVYVDDWTATNNQAPGGMKYSQDGLPVGLGSGAAGGGGTSGYVSQ